MENDKIYLIIAGLQCAAVWLLIGGLHNIYKALLAVQDHLQQIWAVMIKRDGGGS